VLRQVKRDRKSAISLQRSQFDPKFQIQGFTPINHFCMHSKANEECLTTLLLTVFTQRDFVADFLQAKCDFIRKSADLLFWTPLGGLKATYDNHLRLIGKCIVDFILVLIELFFRQVLRLRHYEQNDGSKSAISLQWGPVDPKLHTPTNHSSSQKTRLNDLSCGMKIWTDLSSILSQCTHLTDRRTNGQLSHRYTTSAFHAAQ